MRAPDQGIAADPLESAQCVVIVPGLKKAAFIFGGDYAKGYALWRRGHGWSGPAAVTLAGGSFGLQIGGESTDLIMSLMNRHAI